MKQADTFRYYIRDQSEFDRHYACWASNHRGWAKCKKANKRIAKKRDRRDWRKIYR